MSKFSKTIDAILGGSKSDRLIPTDNEPVIEEAAQNFGLTMTTVIVGGGVVALIMWMCGVPI